MDQTNKQISSILSKLQELDWKTNHSTINNLVNKVSKYLLTVNYIPCTVKMLASQTQPNSMISQSLLSEKPRYLHRMSVILKQGKFSQLMHAINFLDNLESMGSFKIRIY